MTNSREQRIQEQEYWFPYHYIASFDPHFREHLTDTWGINYVSTIEYVLDRLSEFAWDSFVDVGCGDGRFTREVAKRFPDRSILGVDYSERAIALARVMNHDVAAAEFLTCDVRQWTRATCDVVVLMEVLEHIPIDDAESFIAGVRGVLKPGGKLIVTVPHINKAVEYKHFRHFDVPTVSALLRDFFEIQQIVPFERRAFERRLIEGILANRAFVLNSSRLLDLLYRRHKRRVFDCRREKDCQRLFVLAEAR